MNNNELIQQARELCDAAKAAKERGSIVDSAALSWAITQNSVPQLCDALEAAEKENEGLKNILQFNMVQIHGERMTVLDALSSLTARAEKAEAERDAYKAALSHLEHMVSGERSGNRKREHSIGVCADAARARKVLKGE